MMNNEFNYLVSVTITNKGIYDNIEDAINNLIEFMGNTLLNNLENINIEYAINDNIIHILITTGQETKIKTSLIKEYLINKIDNINIKCRTNKLKNIQTLEEYFKVQNKTAYEKQKEAIYKWRENNKENYLLKQHQYFKNKLSNEAFRLSNLQRIKDKKNKIKEENEKNGIFKKVGRPSKYT